MGQLYSYLLTGVVLGACFVVIYFITRAQVTQLEHLEEEIEEASKAGEEAKVHALEAKHHSLENVSVAISIIIVMFNKFCMGKIIHLICDLEKRHTRTSF